VGGRENLGYTREDAKNYLNSKSWRDMIVMKLETCYNISNDN